jgi:oxygen-independent coproporphyrinogen-3 oxidase
MLAVGASTDARSRASPFGPLVDARPAGGSLGLYIHVPFCEKRCYYCAFNTAPMDDATMTRYLGALGREIDLLAALPWARTTTIATVFFGGGTPSLMDAGAMTGVLDRLRGRFAIAHDAEITVECNPDTVTADKLSRYRAAGVTRISLGVQALDDAVLRALGRLHGARQARAAFDAARAAGFDAVSVDLMYGLPGADLGEWIRTVEAVLGWGPDHLSAYGLTLDAGSLWGAAGVPGLPPEDAVVEQYWALARRAAAAGYEHYEISNYARRGRRSAHNQIYWRRGEYLAAGPGACGFVGDLRWRAVKPTARYCAVLEAGALPVDAFERLTARQALGERLILGLRTADGVPTTWLTERCADDARARRAVRTWRERGLLVEAGARTRLTEAGFLLSDALFTELL